MGKIGEAASLSKCNISNDGVFPILGGRLRRVFVDHECIDR